ncbi:MAG: hypothetical protein ACQEP8_05370 [Chlamydiota bacterium]
MIPSIRSEPYCQYKPAKPQHPLSHSEKPANPYPQPSAPSRPSKTILSDRFSLVKIIPLAPPHYWNDKPILVTPEVKRIASTPGKHCGLSTKNFLKVLEVACQNSESRPFGSLFTGYYSVSNVHLAISIRKDFKACPLQIFYLITKIEAGKKPGHKYRPLTKL